MPADAGEAMNVNAAENSATDGEGGVVTGDRFVIVSPMAGNGSSKPQTVGRHVQHVQFGNLFDVDDKFGRKPPRSDVVDQI